MSTHLTMPETKVLAIASHVVYGYVGNTMATFCMQTLGCEVSALHTVHFSNHTGYRQFTGTKATAAEIRDLYTGLQKSHLTDFDVLLSGYAPGAEAVEAVGQIAQDLKAQARTRGDAGGLFWVMDPVMGDNGRLYVSEDVVPAYKALLPFADLILPNQFEAEVLSGIKITDLPSLIEAISKLHSIYKIPHIIVTSVRFPFLHDANDKTSGQSTTGPTLSIVGSTIRTTDSSPRLFHISVPDLDAFFSGTGDMFAALMVARLRMMCSSDGLCGTPDPVTGSSSEGRSGATHEQKSPWLCPDNVEPLDTPLARAAELVCASMCSVLGKTKKQMDQTLANYAAATAASTNSTADASVAPANQEQKAQEDYLRKTKAAEVRVVKYQHEIREPVVVYRAEEVILTAETS